MKRTTLDSSITRLAKSEQDENLTSSTPGVSTISSPLIVELLAAKNGMFSLQIKSCSATAESKNKIKNS